MKAPAVLTLSDSNRPVIMPHHWLSVFFVLTVAFLAVFATPLASPWDEVQVKHAWKTVPDNWESLGPPHPDTTTDLYVALKPQNENALVDALYEVSTPGHPKYGAHLSREEAAELVAPHPETLELVHSWLAHNGVPSSSILATHGGSWLTLTDVPVSQANKLLGASYQLYRHAGANDTTILRTVGYGLPTVLHAHVETVAPTTLFASPRTLQQELHRHPDGATGTLAKAAPRELVRELSTRDDPVAVAPDYLRWLYKTYAYVPRAVTRNALGIVGLRDQFPSPLDLTLFMSLFRRDAQDATFAVVGVNGGGFDPDQPGSEANLNMQYAQAITYPTPHVYYSTGGPVYWGVSSHMPLRGDCFLGWTSYVISRLYIPQTISVSYSIFEDIVPPEYARSVCNLFALIGVRGVSVLFSSGDNGVGKGECKDKSGRVHFMPKFPASCPWLTSVGGTTSARPEIASDLSGGGFSNYFPTPPYQRVAVPAYVRGLRGQYGGLYNPTGRGIPDVSAQAETFQIVNDTLLVGVSGTSCAAPTVAGIISLLNDYLISYERPPLGFLNPWLYTYAREGFNDITSGSNPGCGTEGFSAAVGWDPVTGVGTPDFITLVRVLYTRIVAPAMQGRELQNISDGAAPSRDAKEIEEYFRFNSSNWPS